MQHWVKQMQNLTWLTQLGISLVAPPILCAFGWNWMVEHWGFPPAGILVALAVGFGGSVASGMGFWRMMKRRAKRQQKDTPTAFNQHH
ncbi:MAG: hypothetical protein H9882_07700 [Candidatus Fournierella pullistercoris]|uniref:F0F1-ATPase subunit (ATPase_gene1) n=1 Tax=Candidatus Allofournierella pullistercoris TaxID=2838597 RepID=A0A948WV27_9FIRM|nr:hypothetical protein [Candidatus Fournierella pullistercoris]